MVDAREIPEVEDVVELGRGGREVTHDLLVQFHSGSCNRFRQSLNLCWRRGFMHSQDTA